MKVCAINFIKMQKVCVFFDVAVALVDDGVVVHDEYVVVDRMLVFMMMVVQVNLVLVLCFCCCLYL